MKSECLGKLGYEWGMLEKTKKYMDDHENDKDFICIAILESFLIHARIIYHFMTDNKIKKGALIASDFVDDKKGWEGRKNLHFANCGKKQEINGKTYSAGYYSLIHQHLAHLTEARVNFRPDWPYPSLYNECEEALKDFMECLGKDKKKYLRKNTKSVFLPMDKSTKTFKTSEGFSQALHQDKPW